MSNVLMICGSLRKGSFNRALMNALPALAPADMKLTEAPSFRGFPLYDADLQAKGFPLDVTALADAIRAADAVIIITPEYNYSIPGALKNAIDWVSRLPDQPFKEKPVAIQSATGGPLGGARMQYHLRQAMIFLNAFSFGTPEISSSARRPPNSTKRHWNSRTRSPRSLWPNSSPASRSSSSA
jgi:chromate reductase, NAD(P)H dehydrogenase (quinone)